MAHDKPAPETSLSSDPVSIDMVSITKRFPGVVANQDVTLKVERGSFHAVIGENGAGKSTLLNVLYGRYRPDAGSIRIDGHDVTAALNSPADAIRLGLGLVSQHYSLIPALTVLENTILGSEPTRAGLLNRRTARQRILEICDQLGLGNIDPGIRADRLTVAAGQKVEIVKALYRGARTLLLDEPTATLAPQEAESLFALLQTLLANGTTIVFVTHKLREVMAYSKRVTVLRNGRNSGDFVTSETSPEELLLHMIGPRAPSSVVAATSAPLDDAEAAARAVAVVSGSIDADSSPHARSDRPGGDESDRPPLAPAQRHGAVGPPVLRIENVSVKSSRGVTAVHNVSLDLAGGEIVGIAGIDGSGQRELAECIVGLRRAETGRIELQSNITTRLSVRERQKLGIAYIPEDRHRTALALDFTIAENYLLGHEHERAWGGGAVLNPARMTERANTMIRAYDVRVGQRDSRARARELSGGNQQKIVIARSLESEPRVLVACQPTRGLDVEAAKFVYRSLSEAKSRGVGILLFSLDLDEILEMSDRIVVVFNGRVAGVMPRAEATAERIGALMTGAERAVTPELLKGQGS